MTMCTTLNCGQVQTVILFLHNVTMSTALNCGQVQTVTLFLHNKHNIKLVHMMPSLCRSHSGGDSVSVSIVHHPDIGPTSTSPEMTQR